MNEQKPIITPKGFTHIRDVLARVGVSERTLRYWIEADGIQRYSFGDRRQRFLRNEDVKRLMQPRQIRKGAK